MGWQCKWVRRTRDNVCGTAIHSLQYVVRKELEGLDSAGNGGIGKEQPALLRPNVLGNSLELESKGRS